MCDWKEAWLEEEGEELRDVNWEMEEVRDLKRLMRLGEVLLAGTWGEEGYRREGGRERSGVNINSQFPASCLVRRTMLSKLGQV